MSIDPGHVVPPRALGAPKPTRFRCGARPGSPLECDAAAGHTGCWSECAVRPALIWRVAAFVLIGCRGAASEDPKPQADTQVNERLASLERSVTSLQATVGAQARQMHCFEVQRGMRAAWYEHDRTVLAFVESPCNEVAGVCPETGLPPNTFGRYRVSIAQVVGEADAPFDTLRSRMDDLPELPQARVRSDTNTRIRSTRAAAESATNAYLAECDRGSPPS
jgi:hypothetical protein